MNRFIKPTSNLILNQISNKVVPPLFVSRDFTTKQPAKQQQQQQQQQKWKQPTLYNQNDFLPAKKIEKLTDKLFKNFFNDLYTLPFMDNKGFDKQFNDSLDVWEDITKSTGVRVPKTNISETEKGVEIRVELPGFNKDNVNVQFRGNQLTIEASMKKSNKYNKEKQQQKSDSESSASHSEKESNEKVEDNESIENYEFEFYKSITLPGEIDSSKVKATISNGLLEITVPKESYKSIKQIPVEDKN